jgi:hypothetical protein
LASVAQAIREGRTRARWLFRRDAGPKLIGEGGVSAASLARVRAGSRTHFGVATIPATAIDVVVR